VSNVLISTETLYYMPSYVGSNYTECHSLNH